MPKKPLFISVLAVILITSFIVLFVGSKNQKYEPGGWTEADTAVNQAKHFFAIRKASGEDFRAGPCLSNALITDWVADIVHNPRLPEDDLPQNQCPAFAEGRAAHIVELDLKGNVVKVE